MFAMKDNRSIRWKKLRWKMTGFSWRIVISTSTERKNHARHSSHRNSWRITRKITFCLSITLFDCADTFFVFSQFSLSLSADADGNQLKSIWVHTVLRAPTFAQRFSYCSVFNNHKFIRHATIDQSAWSEEIIIFLNRILRSFFGVARHIIMLMMWCSGEPKQCVTQSPWACITHTILLIDPTSNHQSMLHSLSLWWADNKNVLNTCYFFVS